MQRQLLILFLFLFSLGATATPDALLSAKKEKAQQGQSVETGWYPTRLITPATQFYIKNDQGYLLFKDRDDKTDLHLYKQAPTSDKSKSQGLVKTAELSLAVSVDTSIHTKTKRSKEKKATHIQYDKTDIQQLGKDFQVDTNRVNSRNVTQNKSNYDGGHLVDHKFSAQGSHTDQVNYVPQHHFYNSWLKEYLVKNASGYLEIPLFTKNPPKIKVMGETRYDPIPIGILLVPLEGREIKDMYYFPNNQYNYRQCQKNLGIKKEIASKMAEKFKLQKELQELLWPALIYDVSLKDTYLGQQQTQECTRACVIDELIQGMLCEEYDDDEDVIPALASDVIHHAQSRPSLIYSASKSTLDKMTKDQANPDALSEACNALGHFLVEYAIKNALKSELISTHSRIMFANIMTDFIECYHQVSDEALTLVDGMFAESYQDILDELWSMKEHMQFPDLIFFANLYRKLSSPFIHDCLMNNYAMIGGMELIGNLEVFLELLQLVYEKAKTQDIEVGQGQNLVDLFLEAQNSLAYVIELGHPEEMFEEEFAFLARAKKRVKKWSKAFDRRKGTYITSPNSCTSFVKMKNITDISLEYLGSNSSLIYKKRNH